MQCRNRTVLLALIIGGLCLLDAGAADGKIAVIDLVEVVEAHPDTATADSLLKQQAKEYADERDAMLSSFREQRALFRDGLKDLESPALSDEAKATMLEQLEEQREALQDQERDIQETLMKRQKQLADSSVRMRDRIVEKVERLVASYATAHGVTLVVNASDDASAGLPAVLYADATLDITGAILREIVKEAEASERADEAAETGTTTEEEDEAE